MNQGYITTHTILDKILANTVQEVAARKRALPLIEIIEKAGQASPARDMLSALRRDTVALIAEVKHASPSRGILIEPFDPVALARTYEAGGAAAISVLTDEQFFKGHLDYLRAVREAVRIPVLRKDFIIDAYQVYEGRAAGADAILLIVAALSDEKLKALYALTQSLGMEALVEVHNEAELARALMLQPRLVGINNRDLKTFEVSLDVTQRLAAQVPHTVTLVAESGIFTPAHVRQVGRAGARAILVGEALVKSDTIRKQVQQLASISTA